MEDLLGTTLDTISVTKFKRRGAEQVFEEVRKTGPKVVMKGNDELCVLISPEDYAALMDIVDSAGLLAVAAQRMLNFDLSETIPADEVFAQSGITDEDLTGWDEVEFE